jgi:TRAP-type mannitol/chloroaromatic compound transport system permease small subunit
MKTGFWSRLDYGIQRLIDGFQKLSAVCCIALVLLTAEQVVARYWFQSSSMALQELEWHLFGLIFLLAGASCLARDEHVRVDVVYSHLKAPTRAWINLLGTLLFLLPTCGVLLVYGWQDMLQARAFTHYGGGLGGAAGEASGWWDQIIQFWLQGEASPDPGGLPARWLIKAALPLGALLMSLQGLVWIGRSLSVICRAVKD